MYIVAIAWLYVTLLMGASEPNLTAGVLTFLFYGLIPFAILIWLMGTPQRKRNRLNQEALSLKPPLSDEDTKSAEQNQ